MTIGGLAAACRLEGVSGAGINPDIPDVASISYSRIAATTMRG